MTMPAMNDLSPENSQLAGSTSHFKLGIETLQRQPSDAEKTGLMSYTASNQKLVAEARESAIKAGNSLDGHMTHTHSHGSMNPQATGVVTTVGPKGRTSMSMDKNAAHSSKLKWTVSDMAIAEATRSGLVQANKSLVSKMRIPAMSP